MSVLTEIIKAEITIKGVIPFARFMELALYCPDYGYYERENDTIGQHGDFYTSVSVGPLFGELLAFQFAEWLAGMDGQQIHIAEAGAHDGKLAADILIWLKRQRPVIFERVKYVIVEPSTKRRAWQTAKLAEFCDRVEWISLIEALQPRFSGVIFSNELLDAMPLHRIGWDAKQREWFEWGVSFEDGKFVWTRMERSAGSCAMPQLPDELLAVLPDGFTTETCPMSEIWWRNAAKSLEQGRLLTLDYGLSREEFFSPQRPNGTLRAFRRHSVGLDVLADPGEQDITAHVDFSSVQRTGEVAGLKTELFATQMEFITGIASRFWPEVERVGDWTQQRNRELKTLIHPEHLGRAFKVLVQAR